MVFPCKSVDQERSRFSHAMFSCEPTGRLNPGIGTASAYLWRHEQVSRFRRVYNRVPTSEKRIGQAHAQCASKPGRPSDKERTVNRQRGYTRSFRREFVHSFRRRMEYCISRATMPSLPSFWYDSIIDSARISKYRVLCPFSGSSHKSATAGTTATGGYCQILSNGRFLWSGSYVILGNYG